MVPVSFGTEEEEVQRSRMVDVLMLMVRAGRWFRSLLVRRKKKFNGAGWSMC